MAHITAKQRSRLYAVQALYQWQSVGGDVKEMEFDFLNKREGKISKAFFSELFLGITSSINELDELMVKFLSREIDELGFVEKSILYLGIYELKNSLEVPYKVVINECLRLCEDIAAEGAYKLINSTLDKLSEELREFERQ